MADRCASSFNTYSVALQRGCFTKKHFLNQSIAALRQFIGLLGRFVTVWKNRTGHTNTANYYNPVAHVHRGLMTRINPNSVRSLELLCMRVNVCLEYR